jgi:hypothetical protein
MDAVTESPALGGSQTVVAASVAFSVGDLILEMKVVIFFIVITTVGGSLSGISIQRSFVSASTNPENPISSSTSAGTEVAGITVEPLPFQHKLDYFP